MDRRIDNIFFTADLHLNHENIIKYCNRYYCMTEMEINTLKKLKELDDFHNIRTFKLRPEALKIMENVLISNINSMVSRSDTLYILGDFGFACKTSSKREDKIADIKRRRNRIKCKNVHLILGNHDPLTAKEYVDNKIFLTAQWKKFLSIREKRKLELGISSDNNKLVLDHWPGVSWRGSCRGSIMLHGHCHGAIEEWKSIHMPNTPLIDVSIDNTNNYPISIQEVFKRVETLISRTPDS